MAEATTAAATKPKRGMMFFLPIILLALLLPVGGWFGLKYFNKHKASGSTDSAAELEKKEKEKEKARASLLPKRLPMPITDKVLTYIPGNPKEDVPPRIVTTNALVANSRKPFQIVVLFADTRKKHYGVGQFYLAGDNTDGLMRRMNDLVTTNQAVLLESVTNLLSAKLYKDTKVPGFRQLLRAQLFELSNQILGSNLVQEVIIPEFMTQ